MKLAAYLEKRDESEAAFARRAGLPQQTINQIAFGGGCQVRTARLIVKASRDEPAPGGGTVTFEDLDGE